MRSSTLGCCRSWRRAATSEAGGRSAPGRCTAGVGEKHRFLEADRCASQRAVRGNLVLIWWASLRPKRRTRVVGGVRRLVQLLGPERYSDGADVSEVEVYRGPP